ncbi:hypothetical protein [Rhizocola hellebori]|nr:hypothetical protein [Rhizocola hellebori]
MSRVYHQLSVVDRVERLIMAILATRANKDSAKASLRSAEIAEWALAMAMQVQWSLAKIEG